MIIVKIALIGDGAVGKTTLREKFIGKNYDSSYMMTIGADFATHVVNINGNEVKFQIWDLAGQPRFSVVRSAYYQGVMGCLVVYDVTRIDSFNNIPKWIKEAFNSSGHGQVPLVLLGNKIDLRGDSPGALSQKHGRVLAREINKFLSKKEFKCTYYETSAKTGENVQDAFKELGRIILDHKKKQDELEEKSKINIPPLK
ncbi:MAG: GTP-binding protein [Candidatus Hodarchaeales archaeon]